jgi:AcrR family transcriptional regulator
MLAATLDLLAERGVHGFSTDDVATRAGIGKGAIYRRHASKEELVRAAVGSLVDEGIAIPDTGSTRDDIRTLMQEAVALYGSSERPQLMPNLVAAMAEMPELARTVREGWLARRRAALGEVLLRGIERGDLRPDTDVELALDLLGGPLFYRLLITGGPIDGRLAEGVSELLLRGFGRG